MVRVAHTRAGKPLPFIFTIFPVFFYFALVGGGYYVFVVSLCVRLIRNSSVALAVALLVIYHLTFIMMLWAYAMVILTDPGRVDPAENQSTQQPQVFQFVQPQQQQPQKQGQGQGPQVGHVIDSNKDSSHQVGKPPVIARSGGATLPVTTGETSSSTTLGSEGAMIPGAQQSANQSGYIHITEDPSAQGHPLWCSKCLHVKPERGHHCRVCKRCVLKMDHHCPWILNCVGQDNYKFFVLFICYTAIHCFYLLVTLIPLYMRFPDDSWSHQLEIAGMVGAGVFGFTLSVFTISHCRLILLNRTTIEDHSNELPEGPATCLRKGWKESEGEKNQGSERLYDVGFKENWQQAMGKGWKCLIPVRFPRPEGPIYNQNVVARQWRDYNKQLERQQQEQQMQQPEGQPLDQYASGESTGRSSPPGAIVGAAAAAAADAGAAGAGAGHEVHHRTHSGAHQQDEDQSC